MAEAPKYTKEDLEKIATYNAAQEETLDLASKITEQLKAQKGQNSSILSATDQSNKLHQLELKLQEEIAAQRDKQGRFIKGSSPLIRKNLDMAKDTLKQSPDGN